jgi:hypothetical protein
VTPRATRALAGVCLAVSCGQVLAIVTTGITMPILYEDSMGYLGSARFLSGRSPVPTLAGGNYYRFGYSLLLVPASWISGRASFAYAWAVGVNVMLGLVLVPLSYALARRALLLPRAPSVVAAALAALYPAYLLNTPHAWVELLAAVLFTGWALAVHDVCQRPGLRTALLMSGVAAAALLTHGRFWPLVIVAAALMLWLLVQGHRVPAGSGLLVLMVGVAIAEAGGRYLVRHVWAGWAANSGEEGRFLSNLSPGNLGNVLQAFVGQAWYLQVSTLALAGVGIVGLVRRTVAANRSRGLRVWAAAILAAVVGLWLVSAASTSHPVRVDHRVYGRYIECAVAVLVVVAVAEIVRAGRRAHRLVALSLGLLVLAASILKLTLPAAAFVGNVQELTVLAVVPYQALLDPGPFFSGLRIGTITLMSGMIVVLLVVLLRLSRALASIAAGVVFVVLTVLGGRGEHPYARFWNDLPREVARAVDEHVPPGMRISYDIRNLVVVDRNRLQYLTDYRPIVGYDPASGPPPTPYVISGETYQPPSGWKAEIVATDGPRNVLWRVEAPASG